MKPFDFEKQADEALEIWDDVCKELNIPHFLIYGTALGFYRGGGYIAGDSDIDTRVICKEKKWKELVKKLREKGVIQSGKIQGWEFFYGQIPFAIERSEKIGTIVQGDGMIYKVMPLYASFDTIKYNGRIYHLPHPIEEYLERRYGKNWKNPDSMWNKHGKHEA